MTMVDAFLRSHCRLAIVLAILACLQGCGPDHPPTYPVGGKVVFADGKPLTTGGVVLLESVVTEGLPVNARGLINADGTFKLTTFDDGDGAVAGKHRMLVRPQRDADDYLKRGIIPRPIINPRFERYETSGLEFTVEEGNNEFTVVVEPPTGRWRR
jgi:hypothetical protein